MALLYMDSFDHYATSDILEKWSTSLVTGSGSVLTIDPTNGRRGSQSLRWVSGTNIGPQGAVVKTIPASGTVIFGFGVKLDIPSRIGGAGYQFAGLRDAGVTQLYLRMNTDLSISVVRGPHGSGTVLGTTPIGLAANVYSYIECKVVISDTVGTVDVWINGVNRLSLTAQDTKNTANASANQVFLGMIDAATSSTNSINWDWDDLYILDGTGSAPWNAALGDCRVDVRKPTAPGATTAWTPSAAPNWSCVDDVPPNDDTDYVAATTPGLTDTYVTEDAPVVGGLIYGVQHCLNFKKMDAGVCLVAPVVRHGGADFVGADLNPTTAYSFGLQVAQTNPGTGVAWTEAGFNAAEFGFKKTA